MLTIHQNRIKTLEKIYIYKRLPLAFIGLLFFIPAFSQTPLLDSLRKIDTSDLTDTAAFEIVNLQAIRSQNPDSAIKYSSKLLSLTEGRKDIWRIRAFQALGSAYRDKGEHELAIDNFFSALELARLHTHKAMVSINLADTYKAAEDETNAKLYYNKAIEVFDNSGLLSRSDTIYLMASYTNIGDLQLNLSQYDSAISCFNKAEHLAEKVGNRNFLAIIQGNLAICYANLGQSSEAESEIAKAITYFEEKGHWGTSLEFLLYMVDIHYDRNELEEAKAYATRGLELAQRHGFKKEIQNLSLRLYKIMKLQENNKAALKYHELYAAYRDSLINRESLKKMADQRTEFEVGQKQAEVDLLMEQKKVQRIITIAIAAGAVLTIVLLVVVYRNYRDKNRINKLLEDQKAQLEELNNTKDKFFSIVSHDLRSPVTAFRGISRLIKHAVETKDHEELNEIADHIDQTSKHLSGLLDNLLTWAMQQQGHFPNVPEKLQLKEITDEIRGIFLAMAESKEIALNIDSRDVIIWSDRNSTMTIVRNLVNNAIKFTSSGGEVSLRSSEETGFAKIEIRDTGIGMSQEKVDNLFKMEGEKTSYGTAGEKGLGLGLQLVSEFVAMNNGQLSVSSKEGKGTIFIVKLPLFESVKQEIPS